MSDVRLVLAGGAYDRVVPLQDGRVKPAGLDLSYLAMPIEEVFWRALRHSEFDATELSLGYYWTMRSQGDRRYTAIPVFPSRFFRHGCIYVNAASPLQTLEELRDCTVGIPEYHMTACIWLRGLLQDEAGIAPHEIRWRTGGIESPGRSDRLELSVPDGVDLQPVPEDATLNGLLLDGGLDAVMCPRIPSGYWTGGIRRLLPDYVGEEHRYFERTGIFPMMHVVALRTTLYEQFPWIARSLFDAYQESKARTYAWMEDINALPVSLPWYVAAWEEGRRVMGPDPWTDGIDPNRRALSTFGTYMEQQGLASALDLADLFASTTFDRYVI